MLKEEVHAVLKQLQDVLKVKDSVHICKVLYHGSEIIRNKSEMKFCSVHYQEASRRFCMPTPGLESQLKQENFILGSST